MAKKKQVKKETADPEVTALKEDPETPPIEPEEPEEEATFLDVILPQLDQIKLTLDDASKRNPSLALDHSGNLLKQLTDYIRNNNQ